MLAGEIVHEPLPVHPEVHSTKCAFSPAVAVSVTSASASNGALHASPQSMPSTDDVTVPGPSPASSTLRIGRLKIPLTAMSWEMVRLQTPVPAHEPFHPLN